jgi:hypothetical protein
MLQLLQDILDTDDSYFITCILDLTYFLRIYIPFFIKPVVRSKIPRQISTCSRSLYPQLKGGEGGSIHGHFKENFISQLM